MLTTQIASAVYTINRVPANMSSIVFQGKRSQTGITPFETIVTKKKTHQLGCETWIWMMKLNQKV